jgi:hypothetical protein
MRVAASEVLRPDTKDYPDFASYSRALKEYTKGIQEKVQGWLNEGITEFVDVAGRNYALVSPGRITWYDQNGFSGHRECAEGTYAEELIRYLRDGLQPAIGTLDAFFGTDQWNEGMKRVEEVRRFNERYLENLRKV